MESFVKRFGDILLLVSWRKISRQYFGKKSIWIYRKMDPVDPDDPDQVFSDDELAVLKQAFRDIARRINDVADGL